MNSKRIVEAIILGAFLCAGLVILGFLISSSAVKIRSLDRTVTVKGLSEREVPANIAIWPIKFSEADNDLSNLYSVLQKKAEIIIDTKIKGFSNALWIHVRIPDKGRGKQMVFMFTALQGKILAGLPFGIGPVNENTFASSMFVKTLVRSILETRAGSQSDTHLSVLSYL